MSTVSSNTFESGNSVAVRLPMDIALAPNIRVTIERNGDVLTIRPAHNPAEAKRELRRMLADMAEIGAPQDGIQAREPIEFPLRGGLYGSDEE